MHECTRLLGDLVALPSVNPMGRELPSAITLEHRVTAYLEEFFRGLGVRYERQAVAPQRENIVAYFESPSASKTLVFEAHQDTVPIDSMTIEPFGAVIKEGKLWGRGACDIKGGMAAMLAAFARLVRERPPGACNVVMACTVDEEHTFLGVQELVKRGLRADAAIVAEPTSLRIVKAHKGVCRWRLTTLGRSCHSSTPEQGINAIYRMGPLLSAIARYAERLANERRDPLLGPATLSVGRIEGGTSVNTVPDRCTLEIDRRLIPGEIAMEAPIHFTKWLQTEAEGQTPFECGPLWINCPALSPEKSGDLVTQLSEVIFKKLGRHEVIVVPYGTDASTIAAAGIPSVVFGPGDIAKAHTVDEWVPLDEVALASEILFQFACRS